MKWEGSALAEPFFLLFFICKNLKVFVHSNLTERLNNMLKNMCQKLFIHLQKTFMSFINEN